MFKLVRTAEKAFANRSLLLDEDQLLFTQNNEKVTRTTARSTITGTAKVMTYHDIIAAQEQRDTKNRGRNRGSRKQHNTVVNKRSQSRSGMAGQTQELRKGEEEIRRLGLQDWCHIFPVIREAIHASMR